MERRLLINISALTLTMLLSALLMYNLLLGEAEVGGFGLLGVFLASLFSHLTVVARDLFVPVFLSLTGVYHPVALGFSAGVGGAVGETVTYYWGLNIRRAVWKKAADQPEDRVSRWVRRYGLLAAFLAAASPLPDTPIILLAGSAKLSFLRLLAVEVFGKTIWYSAGAFLGGAIFAQMAASLGTFVSSLLVFAASLTLCVAVYSRRVRSVVFSALQRAAKLLGFRSLPED